jgi:hypothetical protein
MSTYHSFLEWLGSDNVIRMGRNDYRSQCSQYSIRMTKKEAYIYFKKEFIN